MPDSGSIYNGSMSFCMLLELDRMVFGRVTVKEIIGAYPPIQDAHNMLETVLGELLAHIESQTKERLREILDEQKTAQAHVNSRPGAMALAQGKIQMYNEYNERYIQAIVSRLES